jgi:plasmid maintenance system antidote protein VapI
MEQRRQRNATALASLIRSQGVLVHYVAAQVGVSRNYLSRIGRGERRLSPELAQRLAEVIGCEVEDVIAAAEAGK